MIALVLLRAKGIQEVPLVARAIFQGWSPRSRQPISYIADLVEFLHSLPVMPFGRIIEAILYNYKKACQDPRQAGDIRAGRKNQKVTNKQLLIQRLEQRQEKLKDFKGSKSRSRKRRN